jgi:hypothetical protein
LSVALLFYNSLPSTTSACTYIDDGEKTALTNQIKFSKH